MWAALGSAAGSLISAGADWLAGKDAQDQAKKASKKDWERTKEMAQNQIQWRTQDAIKAGLHPLVGAGISPSSGPPGSMVGDSTHISSMGNNIGRAVEALSRPEDKLAAKAALLDIEQRQANIDLTRSQIAGAQKALLSSGATPGIASQIPVQANPLPPGASRKNQFGNIPTRNVMQGQAAEDYAGDFLGSIIAGAASMDDFVRYNWNTNDDWITRTGTNILSKLSQGGPQPYDHYPPLY